MEYIANIQQPKPRKSKYDTVARNEIKPNYQKCWDYYQRNQEAILMRKSEKILCHQCGCMVARGYIKKHQTSNKCMQFFNL